MFTLKIVTGKSETNRHILLEFWKILFSLCRLNLKFVIAPASMMVVMHVFHHPDTCVRPDPTPGINFWKIHDNTPTLCHPGPTTRLSNWHWAQFSLGNVCRRTTLELSTIIAPSQPLKLVCEQFARRSQHSLSAMETRDFSDQWFLT